MFNLIKCRARPNSMSFRGNGSDRGNLPEGETVVSATDDNFYNYSCTIVFVSPVGDFSAVSHRGHLAGANMRLAVSAAGDFSTNDRNDNGPFKASPWGEAVAQRLMRGRTPAQLPS